MLKNSSNLTSSKYNKNIIREFNLDEIDPFTIDYIVDKFEDDFILKIESLFLPKIPDKKLYILLRNKTVSYMRDILYQYKIILNNQLKKIQVNQALIRELPYTNPFNIKITTNNCDKAILENNICLTNNPENNTENDSENIIKKS